MSAQQNKTKFIYWFAHYNLYSPSVRYRGKYPLEYLKSNYGIDYTLVIPAYKFLQIFIFIKAFFSALLGFKKNSLIVIQRLNSKWIYAGLLKLLVKVKSNTMYDIDDADYLEYPPETIYYFMKNCAFVSVGSRELVNNNLKFNRNILFNTSPTPDLGIVKTIRNKKLTVGWIGGFGGGHKASLSEYFFPSLNNLTFDVKLIIFGVESETEKQWLLDYFKNNKKIELVIPMNVNWNNEAEIQIQICEFDIGIATLLDDEIHRSKSAFKLKQYFNNAVPVLSSDIAENNYFLEDGKNGFLCTSPEDFKKRLLQFNNMPDIEYWVLSNNGRKKIFEFNLENYCNTLLQYMNALNR